MLKSAHLIQEVLQQLTSTQALSNASNSKGKSPKITWALVSLSFFYMLLFKVMVEYLSPSELLLEGETGVGKKREEFLPWSPLQSSAGIDNKASVVPTHKIVSHCISIYAEDICTLCALFGWDGEQLSIADAT